MSKQIETDICIIGAGPAGMIIGHILLQAGISCVVLDKYDRERIFSRGRAGLLDCRTADILSHYGLSDGLRTHGQPHGSCEFRSPTGSRILDYSANTNGDKHFVYPQDALVDELIGLFQDKGGDLLFNHEAIQIDNSESGSPSVTCRNRETDETLNIKCRFIAGCDGYHGVARTSIPEGAAKVFTRKYNYNWLSILANAAPSTDKIIYALHPRGFAGHMLRTESVSRYYLQTRHTDTVDDWSDDRIWSELRTRFEKKGWTLIEGEITQKNILEMRTYVIEPLHYRSLFLAGDAAHTITPCGAKGLNMAIHDGEELARAFVKTLKYGDDKALTRYSEIRLPEIWRNEEFSHTMLDTIHKTSSVEGEDDPFLMRVKESRIDQLMQFETTAKDFSRKYVGERLPQREPL